MNEYLVILLDDDNLYPNDRFHITSEKLLQRGHIFSVDDMIYSVVQKDGSKLYCTENILIEGVKKINK